MNTARCSKFIITAHLLMTSMSANSVECTDRVETIISDRNITVEYQVDTCGRKPTLILLSSPTCITDSEVKNLLVKDLRTLQTSSSYFASGSIASLLARISPKTWKLSKYYNSFCFDKNPRQLRCDHYLLGRKRYKSTKCVYQFSFNP